MTLLPYELKKQVLKQTLIQFVDLILAILLLSILTIDQFIYPIKTFIELFPFLVFGILCLALARWNNKVIALINISYKTLCYTSIVFLYSNLQEKKIIFHWALISSLIVTVIFGLSYLFKKENGVYAIQAFLYFLLHFTLYYLFSSSGII